MTLLITIIVIPPTLRFSTTKHSNLHSSYFLLWHNKNAQQKYNGFELSWGLTSQRMCNNHKYQVNVSIFDEIESLV